MPINRHTQALRRGFKALASVAGSEFVFGEIAFKAWPASPLETSGSTPSESPSHLLWFEAFAGGVPLFKKTDVLVDDAGRRYTVHQRNPLDVTKGTFRFQLYPPREVCP